MFTLLKWNTLLTLTQFVFSIFIFFLTRGDILITTVLAFGVVLFFDFFTPKTPFTPLALAVAFSAFVTIPLIDIIFFIPLYANPGTDFFLDPIKTVVLMSFICLIFSFSAAITFRGEGGDGFKEPLWALTIASLPAFVGTVFGGLLYLLFFRKKNNVLV